MIEFKNLDRDGFVELLPEQKQRDLFFKIAANGTYSAKDSETSVMQELYSAGLLIKPEILKNNIVKSRLRRDARAMLERLWPDDGW